MANIPENYIERLYAGWLGKIIGIRLGAAIEGWSYQRIREVFGELHNYPVPYVDFAADDDSNGPIFFIRALEDCKDIHNMEAQDVGEALLNYAPYEHGFFWWGGYGISTEHTAYLNLRNGIKAPASGSILQNGHAVAEQIGGQIFIDTWGLVAPGNPDLAARYAEKAASVTHDGNGIYGGIFIAVCISLAFVEQDMQSIIEKALDYIPSDCEYTRVVRAVQEFHSKAPQDWRACFDYVHANFGYDRYPGNCHIIPNTAVIVLALLYGEGDFSDSINICNMCGWDTDCNVANVGTILGVLKGLESIDFDRWRAPINDFLACSSVIGSLNQMDIPFGTSYLAALAYRLAGQEPPELWKPILDKRMDSCHFEYPGSTHAIRHSGSGEFAMHNTNEAAFSGKRSLKISSYHMTAGENACFFKKTYYSPKDFHDSRYDPSFSPSLYPGQTVHAAVCVSKSSDPCTVRLYVREGHTGKLYFGDEMDCPAGEWAELALVIPAMPDGRIDEAGVQVTAKPSPGWDKTVTIYLDDLYFSGSPNYGIAFEKENEEVWLGVHREISQFTNVKGLFYLCDDVLHASCSDFAEAYTGSHDWQDYSLSGQLLPQTGNHHLFNLRVQGAIRSYGVGLWGPNRLAILKNENGYNVLAEVDFPWEHGKSYLLETRVQGNRIAVYRDNVELLSVVDTVNPYLRGSVGLSVHNGSHCGYKKFAIK